MISHGRLQGGIDFGAIIVGRVLRNSIRATTTTGIGAAVVVGAAVVAGPAVVAVFDAAVADVMPGVSVVVVSSVDCDIV